MTYRANNIAQANPITRFLQILEADMTNVGWVNVSSQVTANYTANAGNSGASNVNTSFLVDVFKSPAGNNSIANDWYVFLGTDTATNTYLLVSMAQAFNTSTNLVTNYCFATQSGPSNNAYANQFCSNANTTNLYFTTVNGNSVSGANGSNARVFSLNTGSLMNTSVSNGINYYYSVTIDRLIISVANNTTLNTNGSAFYIGMYDSFMPLTIDPFPLIIANIATVVQDSSYPFQGMAITEPQYTANNSPPSGQAGNFFFNASYAWNPIIAQSFGDRYLGSGAPGGSAFQFSRIVFGGQGGTGGGGSGTGWRGLLRDCLVTNLQCGRGDLTFWNINGVTYNATCISNGTGNWNAGPASAFGPFMLQV